MSEIELNPKKISNSDNTEYVEMSEDEIWFLKYLLMKYKPKKIVEIGISAGGNTVNLLKWKDKHSKLFSIDISKSWYRDNNKLSGFYAEELEIKDNWEIYRGHDYLDVYEEIGNDIDFIIIDTVHALPGEVLTFLATLPQLKDGCIVVLHDIHLNMIGFSENNFNEYTLAAYCTGLLFGGVSSNLKWSLKSDTLSNIGAFVVDNSTRENIKDIFHILCSSWRSFPYELDLIKYSNFIHENYSIDCYNLFDMCLKLQLKYFNRNYEPIARVDLYNYNEENNSIEILNNPNSVDISFPDWFNTKQGKGSVIQTSVRTFDIQLKCINDGTLKISLRGPDIRNKLGEQIQQYVNFTVFKVNNEDILKNSIFVWHGSPYVFEKNVKDGEIINVHIEFYV